MPQRGRGKGTGAGGPISRRGLLWLALACIAVFVASFTLVNFLVMPRAVHSSREIEVPNVVGMTFEEAQRTLDELDLRVSRAAEVSNGDLPAGRVVSADPNVGMSVRPGRVIALTMSLGPEMVRIPPITRQTVRRAQLLLQSVGLAAGDVSYAYSTDVQRGLVVDCSPQADSLTAPGGTVNMRVSLGPPPPQNVMADLRGWRVDGVEVLLREQGYLVAVNGVPAGESSGDRVVIDQFPPAGSTVGIGDSVLIVAGTTR